MDQETGWKELMRQAKSGDAEAQCRLGRTEKNPERAEYWLEKAVAANPDDDDALYNLGLLAQQTGDCRKAAAYFTRVLEIDPQDPYSHYRLGRIRLFGLDGSPDPAAAGFHLEAARKKLGCARRLL